ncbi:MAG: UvrD-helicase domain-containing protein [candidate division WOR-3 bacterium]
MQDRGCENQDESGRGARHQGAIDRVREIGAHELRADPVGHERFPDYSRLFPASLDDRSAGSPDHSHPRPLDPSPFEEVARRLKESARIYLTKSNTPLRERCDSATRHWNEQLYEYGLLVRSVLSHIEFRRTFELFRDFFLSAYTRTKNELGQVDYDDMELLALNLLIQNPEWQNVLYAFDEHTDHLLVDEFQDTSFVQWGIVDKLTEEWRSGEGIKSARGIQPTVFVVGDDKQSIYMFRNANVEVFAGVADQLERWLGPDRFERLELEDNYRSLSAIIDFNNTLFARLMAGDSRAAGSDTERQAVEPWRTRYRPFRRARNNAATGVVEIILDELEAGMTERRQRDAANVCRRNLLIHDPESRFQVFERSVGEEFGRM